MSFLTVEDINTALLKYEKINLWHHIQINQGVGHYYYDFIDCSTTKSNDVYTHLIKVNNDLWTGRFYLRFRDRDYSMVYGDDTIQISTKEPVLDIYFQIGGYTTGKRVCYIPFAILDIEQEFYTPNKPLDIHFKLETPINYFDVRYGGWDWEETITVNINDSYLDLHIVDNRLISYLKISEKGNADDYYLIHIKQDKSINALFPVNQDLILGEINTVNFLYVGDEETPPISRFEIICDYPISDINENSFKLDLTNKFDTNNVQIKYKLTDDVTYDCIPFEKDYTVKYNTVSDVTGLNSFFDKQGKVLTVSNEITLNKSLYVYNDMVITGENAVIDCNGYNIIVNGELTIDGVTFRNSPRVFIQNNNSKLTIKNCTFTGNGFGVNVGGVVFCNYSDENNIRTIISNSRFINNNSCIFHTGELTVMDCYFEVNNEFKHEEIDVNNVFGIYQTSGELKFNNNEVYFDLTNDYYTVNRINIGFKQAILNIGESAIVNGNSTDKLLVNNNAFLQNNKITTTSKYYRNDVSSNVNVTSVNTSNSNYLWIIENYDYIFRTNTEINRE